MNNSPNHSDAPYRDDADFLAAIERAVGPKGISRDADDMAPWLTDWRGRYHGAALALVSPANIAEVSIVVKCCARHGVAIVPQGGNSGMVGGATPDGSGRSILLSLRKMDSIIDIDAESGLVRAEAGVILQNLHEAVLEKGQRFPLSLGGKGSATVGGLISTNAGGTQVFRHGTMRALVAGLQAVLPDGQIFDAMAPLKKDNRGYDFRHLLIGAEGTLGIVTAATLRTVPALIDRTVAWVGLSDPESAYRLLRQIEGRSAGQLEGFEILPQSCLTNVLTHIEGTSAPLPERHRWHALLEWVKDRETQENPQELATRLLADALEKGLIENAVLAQNETQAEMFWKIRETISEAERAAGPAMQHDISVPVEQMADFITEQTDIIEGRWTGARVAAFGHMGDGNVHFHVKAPDGVDPQSWYGSVAKDISHHVYDAVTRASGSISAEHGIGQDKLAELQRLGDPVRLKMLTEVKRAFDPQNIMNPGKLVSLASSNGSN